MTTTLLQEVAREVLNTKNQEDEVFDEKLNQASSSVESLNPTDQSTRTRLDSTSHGEDMKNSANELIAQCYNKLAACILNGSPRKNDDYLRAVYYCDKVFIIFISISLFFRY